MAEMTVAVRHDVLDLLISQHTRIRDLFSEVESSTGPARREAFDRLVRLLVVHENIEEQYVHPLTRRHVHGGDDIVEDRLAEERLAKQCLAALQRMGPGAAEFPRLLTELRVGVLEHANHEEAYEFRYLRRDVPAAELQALAATIETGQANTPG